MTSKQAADRKLQTFSNAFFSVMVEAIGEASGTNWQVDEDSSAEPISDPTDRVWIRLSFAGSLRGDCFLELDRAEAMMLATRMLEQPVEEFGPQESEAVLKPIEAAMAKLTAGLEQEYGTFTVETATVEEYPSDLASPIQMVATDSEGDRLAMWMYLGTVLSEALFLHSQVENAVAGAGRATDVSDESAVEQVNLNLVMDVELNVTLRFGQRQLSLREILDLTTGSVVELDRQVEEPVELLLDGTVIARGEAVVIDGNYGLRVTEVAQPVSKMIR